MVLQCGEHILGTAALCELAVAVIAYHLDCALHIGLVGYEGFAEGVALACSFQDLSLKEGEGRVVPARTRTVLVLDGGDGVLLDDGEYRLVSVFGGFLLLGSRCTEGDHRHECDS